MGLLLPIGRQDIESIREGGYCYVDKTAIIHRLITGSSGAVFLSRPRRFGKSLLCSTLEAIFEGRRDLFGQMAGRPALAIDSLDWAWKKHPVVALDLSTAMLSGGAKALRNLISDDLGVCARRFGIELPCGDVVVKFRFLIRTLCEMSGERVVVIIDEYDAPLLETMDKPRTHDRVREDLGKFYGVLKSYSRYLRFVFITGITKFSHVSIFSQLNHLNDLSFDTIFADICGISQDELEANFETEIAAVVESTKRNRKKYLADLRRFYNGYRFTKTSTTVYNPFGLLLHFDKGGDFVSYWYNTASPSFLLRLVASQAIHVAKLSSMRVTESHFHRYDASNMEAVPILYQTGYLTVSSYDAKTGEYVLDFPNLEVSSAFSQSLVVQHLSVSTQIADSVVTKLPLAFSQGNLDGAMEVIRLFLASVPYQIIKPFENYFETVLFVVFRMLGLDCDVELQTATGRIDVVVKTPRYIYCFEFKLNDSADNALAQIDSKDYTLQWRGGRKKVIKVGVMFDEKTRNIGEWKHVAA
jgi:hypothetical protein